MTRSSLISYVFVQPSLEIDRRKGSKRECVKEICSQGHAGRQTDKETNTQISREMDWCWIRQKHSLTDFGIHIA